MLSYPGPIFRNADLPPNEKATLADGRVARLEYRASTTIDVPDAEALRADGDYCSSFWISIPGNEREMAIAIAERVFVRPPEGATTVPDVSGLGALDAQDVLARAGLVPSPIESVPTESAPRVVSQSMPPGTEVDIGTTVDLVYAPSPTTTAPTTLDPREVTFPVPDAPIICPHERMEIDDLITSIPTVAFDDTLQWDQPDGYTVQLRWPGPHGASGNFRDLEIDGRPARMYDGGDGQNLVYDTGLPSGPCQFVELRVFGGPSIDERERRAEALATDGISFPPIPDISPPDVVGMTVAEAADTLARSGFIPDWGIRPTLPGDGDPPLGESLPPTDQRVTGQGDGGEYVVRLTID